LLVALNTREGKLTGAQTRSALHGGTAKRIGEKRVRCLLLQVRTGYAHGLRLSDKDGRVPECGQRP